MTAEWHVLVEEDTRETRQADGTELRLHHWKLVGIHPVDGSEEQAVAAAEELALQHVPALLARHMRSGDKPARRAFRSRDGTWVVLVGQRHRESHIRVTVAQLVHTVEEEEGPKTSLKEKIRRNFTSM